MKIEVEIPTHDGWIETTSGVLPKDGEICVVIRKYGNKTPEIVQFRKADWIYDSKHDYFLCIDELFYFAELGIDVKNDSDVNPSFCPLGIVRYWKSLDLPEDIDRNIKEIITYWFEEEEDETIDRT